MILYHYTNADGLRGIIASGILFASTQARNPSDVRYGNGQYLTDIEPATKTASQLSRQFLGQPFQGKRFTHYVAIEVEGLSLIEGRPGVYVIPGEIPLDISTRIVGGGPAFPTTHD